MEVSGPIRLPFVYSDKAEKRLDTLTAALSFCGTTLSSLRHPVALLGAVFLSPLLLDDVTATVLASAG